MASRSKKIIIGFWKLFYFFYLAALTSFAGLSWQFSASECTINNPFLTDFYLFNLTYIALENCLAMLEIIKILSTFKACGICRLNEKQSHFAHKLLRLIDPREYLWRMNIFIIRNLIYFLFKTGLLLTWFIISIIEISLQEKKEEYKCKVKYNIQIASIVFSFVALIAIFFQYYYIELFTPEGLEEAEKELTENKVKEFKEIEEKSIEIVNKPKLRRYLILSKLQFNFIPQFGRFARISLLGSGHCLAGTKCQSVDLEHIFYYHNEFELPNQEDRCFYSCLCAQNYLVGFHQTSREAALKISLSPMRITQDGMFGDGIYFAR